MTHDLDGAMSESPEPTRRAVGDELDRLRLALLHERSRADAAEHALAELRARADGAADEARSEPPVAPEPPVAGRSRRPWRRR